MTKNGCEYRWGENNKKRTIFQTEKRHCEQCLILNLMDVVKSTPHKNRLEYQSIIISCGCCCFSLFVVHLLLIFYSPQKAQRTLINFPTLNRFFVRLFFIHCVMHFIIYESKGIVRHWKMKRIKCEQQQQQQQKISEIAWLSSAWKSATYYVVFESILRSFQSTYYVAILL